MAARARLRECGIGRRPFRWNLTALPSEPNCRGPGIFPLSRENALEESPDSLKQRCRVTPGRSNPTESATEIKPLPQGSKGETVG